jgi:hypothetical protein
VIHLFRLVPRLLWALGIMGALAPAPAAAATAAAPLAPGVAVLLAAQPWSALASVETSYGYNDNLLLSAAGEERSAFARTSIEFLLLHLSHNQFDFSTFTQLDGTYFFAGKAVDHEASAWLQMEPGYRFGSKWNVTLPITGYYSDEVFDISDTEVERLVAEIKVTGVMVGPTVRWTFLPSWWVEAQAVGERKYYEEKTNDGDVGDGTIRLGWTHDRVEVRLTGTRRWRDFRSRSQYNPVGREQLGTHLKIAERTGEFRFDITWDTEKRWETITRASLLHYEDNGSGFFSFREQKIAQDLEWTNEPWRVLLGGTAARVDYDVQTVGFGTEPAARLRDEFTAELRVERALSKSWKLVASYRWERSRSNDPIASYVVNEGLLGLRWSWDK